MKTGTGAVAVAIYISCPYCGSTEVSGKHSGSFLITERDEVAVCTSCEKECKVPQRLFNTGREATR